MPRSRSKSRRVRSRLSEQNPSHGLYLLHTSYGTHSDRFLKILQSGFLKPGIQTGQQGMYGSPSSKCVYTRINTDNDTLAHFYIDYKILLSCKFSLHLGWSSEDSDTPDDLIDGTKLTPNKLKQMLLKFKSNVEKFSNENSNKASLPFMLNEILIYTEVDLHKYLRKANLWDFDSINYLKENYKNVELL